MPRAGHNKSVLAVSEAGGAKWAEFVCVSFMGSPPVQWGHRSLSGSAPSDPLGSDHGSHKSRA